MPRVSLHRLQLRPLHLACAMSLLVATLSTAACSGDDANDTAPNGGDVTVERDARSSMDARADGRAEQRDDRGTVDRDASSNGGDDARAEDGGASTDTRDAAVDTGEADTGPAKPTGAACPKDGVCAGGRCLQSDHPDGYCTSVECTRDGVCTGEAVCATLPGRAPRCLKTCTDESDCRDGYACRSFGNDGDRACRPEVAPPPKTFEEMKKVLGVTCDPKKGAPTEEGVRYTFTFSIGPNSGGFLMVPYVTYGKVRPLELKTPNTTVDMVYDYRHHNSKFTQYPRPPSLSGVGTYGEIAFDWPIVVPYAPKRSDLLVPGGTYEYTVVTAEDSPNKSKTPTPCLYVLDHPGKGTTLDLNFYLVGANGMDASEARADKDLEVVLHWVEHIYRKVGIELGNVRYVDVPKSVEQMYKNVKSKDQARELMAHGAPPNGSLEGHLTVDVFLVNDLQVDSSREGGNVLGMSAGVPGNGGIHGNARSGLVFTVADLGKANQHVGHVMAHEIGHFLGLRHTTEVVHGKSSSAVEQFDRFLGTTDPIEDTPVCDDIAEKIQRNPYDCPDATNLMYPLAPRPSQNIDPTLTSKQGKALKANPLVRQDGEASP